VRITRLTNSRIGWVEAEQEFGHGGFAGADEVGGLAG
jgi:hypothetical protein